MVVVPSQKHGSQICSMIVVVHAPVVGDGPRTTVRTSEAGHRSTTPESMMMLISRRLRIGFMGAPFLTLVGGAGVGVGGVDALSPLAAVDAARG